MVALPPPAAHTAPYLIVEQEGDVAVVGGRRGGGDLLVGRLPLL